MDLQLLDIIVGIVAIVVSALVSWFVARWQLQQSADAEEDRTRVEEDRRRAEEDRRKAEEIREKATRISEFLTFLDSRRLLRDQAVNYADYYSSSEPMHEALEEIHRRLIDFSGFMCGEEGYEEVHQKLAKMEEFCKDLLIEVEKSRYANDWPPSKDLSALVKRFRQASNEARRELDENRRKLRSREFS